MRQSTALHATRRNQVSAVVRQAKHYCVVIERVPDGVSLTSIQPAGTEGDVGHPHAGAAKRRVALHPRPGP